MLPAVSLTAVQHVLFCFAALSAPFTSFYPIEIVVFSIFFVFFVNFVEKALAAVW